MRVACRQMISTLSLSPIKQTNSGCSIKQQSFFPSSINVYNKRKWLLNSFILWKMWRANQELHIFYEQIKYGAKTIWKEEGWGGRQAGRAWWVSLSFLMGSSCAGAYCHFPPSLSLFCGCPHKWMWRRAAACQACPFCPLLSPPSPGRGRTSKPPGSNYTCRALWWWPHHTAVRVYLQWYNNIQCPHQKLQGVVAQKMSLKASCNFKLVKKDCGTHWGSVRHTRSGEPRL